MIIPESFTTSRLELRRPLLTDDPVAIFAYGGDPEVAKYMDWPVTERVEDSRRVIESAVQKWESGDEYSWRIMVKPDDTPVGGVGATIRGHRAELGFLLSRSLWGKGITTEAAGAVLDWLKSLDELQRIQAKCDVDNVASARVLEKLGLNREGVLRRWTMRPNLPGRPIRDALIYSWVRE